MVYATAIKTILGTVAVAFAAGFVLQLTNSGDIDVTNVTEVPQTTVTSVMAVNNAQGSSRFGVSDVVTTPLPHVRNIEAVAAVANTYVEPETPALGTVQAGPGGQCQAKLDAVPAVAALVDLTLTAPCNRNASFVIRHGSMLFSERTDADGNARLRVPALSVDARFTVSFANVETAAVAVNMPDVRSRHRVVLQWRGTDNLKLHALEFGAQIGEPGHIWTASTAAAETAEGAAHGFMVHLGRTDTDIPYQAEIYTHPINTDGVADEIQLDVGAVVTAENCGRALDAVAIQSVGGETGLRQLRIPMPSCNAQTASLLVPNMFADMALTAH